MARKKIAVSLDTFIQSFRWNFGSVFFTCSDAKYSQTATVFQHTLCIPSLTLFPQQRLLCLFFSYCIMISPLECHTPVQHAHGNPMDFWNHSLRVRKPHTPNATHNTGRWESRERLTFLYGLRLYGKGKWKQISELISTR